MPLGDHLLAASSHVGKVFTKVFTWLNSKRLYPREKGELYINLGVMLLDPYRYKARLQKAAL